MVYGSIALIGLGLILRFGGGLAAFGALLAGVYFMLFQSFLLGLVVIGGAVVAGWVLNFLSGLILLAGGALANRSAPN